MTSQNDQRPLPPGISDAAFDKAITRFEAIVGADGLLATPEELVDSADPYAFGAGPFAPSAALSPKSVEEIQAILKVANETRIPLWTVSRGRNYGYGGSAPRLAGSIILDLKRMNRIITVDEDSAYALIEPGVSFFDLYDHFQANGQKLWMSSPALSWGSVVGNALERGLGTHSYADHETNICGMEIALADGDILRTGIGGGLDGGPTWQVNRGSFGPSPEGLFLQSNYGIVTKMGMWMMPCPECFRICEVKFPKDSDLGPMIETLRPLKVDGTIDCRAIAVNAIRIAQGVSKRTDWYDGKGAVPDSAIEAMKQKFGIGAWNLIFGLYGLEGVVEARHKIVKEAFEKIPGAEFKSTKYAGDAAKDEIETRHHMFAGIPGIQHLAILGWAGENGAHLGFSPISPLTAKDAMRQATMVRETAARFGFDYGTAFGALGRRLNHVFMIVFDKTDEEETARARAMFKAMVEEGAAAGYGEYRTHLAYMDLVAEQYQFNNHAQRRFNETIKDALDPNGILSPGKQGIWPEHLRHHRHR